MTGLAWIVVAVGAFVILAIIIAASEIEKRLDRVIALLEKANEMTHENRTGDWRDR